jgi:putative holliday junction resolvase
MSRWLAIDPGDKRLGVAVGSTGEGIATPLDVIPAHPEDQAIRKILHYAREYQADGLVVGWPLNMDDTEGPQGKSARDMAVRLREQTGLDVRMWDERLSSFSADQALAGLWSRKKKKARQDAVAAAAILQDFLAQGGPDAAPRPEELG